VRNTLTLNALRQHWFVLAAILLVATDATVIRLQLHHASAPLVEMALLADLAVVLPCLYLACYRRQGRRALVRALSLALLGVWAASKIIPASEQGLLTELSALRDAGLAILAVLEARLLFAVYKAAFKGESAQQLEARLTQHANLPPWVAKLAALEAAFWAKVLQKLRSLLQRRR
jgi:hypothetical protein